jgi:energy-coupling factor transport system permease protein
MMIGYIARDSVLHRLDARTKIIWSAVLVGLAFIIPHPLCSLAIAAILCVFFGLGRLPGSGLRRILVMLAPILLIVLVMTAFSYSPDHFTTASSQRVYFSLFPNNTAPLTTGGILLGCMFVCRIIVMVLVSLLLTYTTPLDDVLQVSRKLHMPSTIAFVMATAVRFIPTMDEKSQMVLDAQRSRGARIDGGGFLRTVRSYVSIMVPLIVDSIRMSENLAVALVNRGFGSGKQVTFLYEIRMNPRDYVLSALALLLLTAGIIARAQGIFEL